MWPIGHPPASMLCWFWSLIFACGSRVENFIDLTSGLMLPVGWIYLAVRLLAANAMSQNMMSSIDVHVTTLQRIGPNWDIVEIYNSMAK